MNRPPPDLQGFQNLGGLREVGLAGGDVREFSVSEVLAQ